MMLAQREPGVARIRGRPCRATPGSLTAAALCWALAALCCSCHVAGSTFKGLGRTAGEPDRHWMGLDGRVATRFLAASPLPAGGGNHTGDDDKDKDKNKNTNATTSTNCTAFNFNGLKMKFEKCVKLDDLGRFQLWWTVNTTTNITRVAFQGLSANPYAWASWGVSPDGSGDMIGAYALVAYANQLGDSPKEVSANLFYMPSKVPQSFQTNVTNGPIALVGGAAISFAGGGKVVKLVTRLSGLTAGPQTIIWQGGLSVIDFAVPTLGPHNVPTPKVSKNVNFVEGTVTNGSTETTAYANQKVIHSWLAGIGFGVLLPLGILVARHVKVWLDPLWFYSHMGLQICGYILGVTGWSYGIWLSLKYGSMSLAPAYQFNHYCIGITIFCTATLQVLTPILKPHKGAPLRLAWNIVHWGLGYTTIALAIANVFLGFQILSAEGINYGNWKTGYIVFICIWGGLMIILEPISWWRYMNRREEDDEEDDDEEYDEDDEDEDEEEGYDDVENKNKNKNKHDRDDDDDDDAEDEDEDEEEEEGDDHDDGDDDDDDDDDYDKKKRR